MSVILAAADHLKPRNWRGDTRVEMVNIHTCWKSGHRIAEDILTSAAKLFGELEKGVDGKSIDILAPGGTLLVKVPLAEDDVEGDEDNMAVEETLPEPENELLSSNAEARIEVEDETGMLREEVSASSQDFSCTIVLNGKPTVKSRYLTSYSKFWKTTSSTD